nr:hypothetical protein [Micromonospora sp. DSM 115978]
MTEADVLDRLADRYKMTTAVEILRRYLGNSRSPDAPVADG